MIFQKQYPASTKFMSHVKKENKQNKKKKERNLTHRLSKQFKYQQEL